MARLAESSAASGTRERFRRYWLSFAEAREPGLATVAGLDVHESIELELPNLAAAIELGLESPDLAPLAVGVGTTLRRCVWSGRPPLREAERLWDSLLAAEEAASPRGKLQNLVFDNQALASHRAMAAVLGAVLRLPPVQRAMASGQMKSRYLEWLLATKPVKTLASGRRR